MSKIVAIIQARTGSTRLPGKVLMPLAGQPAILRMLERLQACRLIDKIVLATSTKANDDAVEDVCQKAGYQVFRGSESDVLDRYYQAALAAQADVVVRVTGDCPLIDPELVDKVVQAFLEEGCDYCCNNKPRTLPHGLDTEITRLDVLRRAWEEGIKPDEREHVTPYIRNHPELFSQINITHGENLSAHRWTVDYQEDYDFVSRVYDLLYHKKGIFSMNDILQLLEDRPELTEINAHLAIEG